MDRAWPRYCHPGRRTDDHHAADPDPAGEDYVGIPRDEYERLRADADEDAADVAIIRRVLDDPDETWAPAELVRQIVEGEHPVRVCRTHRRMTARSLAVAASTPSSYLSAIERGSLSLDPPLRIIPGPARTLQLSSFCNRSSD